MEGDFGWGFEVIVGWYIHEDVITSIILISASTEYNFEN